MDIFDHDYIFINRKIKMSLYPSLEDMQVHKIVQAQHKAVNNHMNTEQMFVGNTQNAYQSFGIPAAATASVVDKPNPSAPVLYPGLGDFMGLELTNEMIAVNMPEYMRNTTDLTTTMNATSSMIAPLSNQTVGLKRAHVTNCIREVIVCKAADNKIGLRVKDINNGIFIVLVCKDSPAALVG